MMKRVDIHHEGAEEEIPSLVDLQAAALKRGVAWWWAGELVTTHAYRVSAA